jgi:hypothetical protein
MEEIKTKSWKMRWSVTFNCVPIKGCDEGLPGVESVRKELRWLRGTTDQSRPTSNWPIGRFVWNGAGCLGC